MHTHAQNNTESQWTFLSQRRKGVSLLLLPHFYGQILLRFMRTINGSIVTYQQITIDTGSEIPPGPPQALQGIHSRLRHSVNNAFGLCWAAVTHIFAHDPGAWILTEGAQVKCAALQKQQLCLVPGLNPLTSFYKYNSTGTVRKVRLLVGR